MRSVIDVALVILLVVIFIIGIMGSRTNAHEAQKVAGFSTWQYDKDCCSDKDCAPVIKAERVTNSVGNGGWKVTTKFGTGIFWDTQDQKWVRESKDNKMHACIIDLEKALGQTGLGTHVRCIYLPNLL